MKDEAESELNRLMRGVSSDHVETVRDAWRAVLAAGDSAVPLVRHRLQSDVWGSPPKGPVGKYLGVLLAVLHQLDAKVFGVEIERLQCERLHPIHAQTVKIMAGRRNEAPVAWVGPITEQVPVYVSKDLDDRRGIAEKIDHWCHTPGLDLRKVTRIDVIDHAPGIDYLGCYDLFFSGIVMVWPGIRAGPRWLRRLAREHTFYHEVGHHACGHAEFGQVTEQEREADAYAAKMMRVAHPVLIRVGRVIFWPLRGLARRSRLRRERLSE
ncbi:hypothetical protein RXV86_16295 [Alisedimentitalea sp. MJ-SS2]|uniref:hypothetical protein n=1 Tax=Aliisedimentitalea sp. MJ-SS2 TaxID=3049795 RepID=UPI002906D808|nr:hypothetical protein [Alisedimentitalea sp. MJ-SS2]MDU8928955.1 hypothetical protein [Alisedimentitalea sp. MJ-SS2]